MATIGLLLKSYAGDLAYAKRLLASYGRHNVEGLHLHCVVPQEDVELFRPLTTDLVTVHAEEEILGSRLVAEPIGDLRVGYANQEIVKLAFWETGLLDNYFCIDSDAVILRGFTAADFMHDSETPYTVLVEDNDLKSDPAYYREHWIGREASIRRIAAELGTPARVLRTSHGHQIMSSRALRSLREDFMDPRGWDYRDLLGISPYEFSWYALWVQHFGPIPVHQREPLVKVFHTEDQYIAALLSGITESDLARGYLAVVVNSNFSRDLGPLSVGGDKTSSLVPLLSYGQVSQLFGRKLSDTWRRLLRPRRSTEPGP